MLRIFRGLKIVRKYEADFAINYQALSISMLLLVLLVTAHWIACLLALICKYDPLSPALEVFLPNMIEMDEEITRFKQYYYCFLWGLMFMTIGMGEGHDGKEESSVWKGVHLDSAHRRRRGQRGDHRRCRGDCGRNERSEPRVLL